MAASLTFPCLEPFPRADLSWLPVGMEGSSAEPDTRLEQKQMFLVFEGCIFIVASSVLCTSLCLYSHSHLYCNLTPVLSPDSCMTCRSRDLYKRVFTGQFSFSLRIIVPACREAWSRHGARSPLFSFVCCYACFLATYQLQTMTCCRVLVLLRLARQKEEQGMQCISEVLGFLFNFGGWNADCGLETAVQQVFYIWPEKFNVFPCQSSHICDYSCSIETQGQASFAEL